MIERFGWVGLLLGVPVAVAIACALALKLRRGLESLATAQIVRWRCLVKRSLAPYQATLDSRIQILELLVAAAGLREGILRARGIVVSNAHGSELFTVTTTDDGVVAVSLDSGKGGASIGALANGDGCGVNFYDSDHRVRLSASASLDATCLTLSTPDEELLAGFIVNGQEPVLLLPRRPTRGPRDKKPTPGYL